MYYRTAYLMSRQNSWDGFYLELLGQPHSSHRGYYHVPVPEFDNPRIIFQILIGRDDSLLLPTLQRSDSA